MQCLHCRVHSQATWAHPQPSVTESLGPRDRIQPSAHTTLLAAEAYPRLPQPNCPAHPDGSLGACTHRSVRSHGRVLIGLRTRSRALEPVDLCVYVVDSEPPVAFTSGAGEQMLRVALTVADQVPRRGPLLPCRGRAP